MTRRILAIGYSVRSYRGMLFCGWATERLSKYLIKGFVLDDKQLMNGRSIGTDCFDELIEHIQDIRDIRASLTQFYQKNTDICTLAIDYDQHVKNTARIFQDLAEQAALGNRRP